MYELIENIYLCLRIRILISAYGFNSMHETENCHEHLQLTYKQNVHRHKHTHKQKLSWLSLHFTRFLSFALHHAFIHALQIK